MLFVFYVYNIIVVERVKELDNFFKDKEYLNNIEDILENDKFKKLADCKHHGLSRLQHSLKVSYYSYVVAKKLRLDYRAVARAGLLHDFFIDDDLKGGKKRLSMVFHPYKSLENATCYFELNDMEKDIIISHMFPTLPHKVPKYLESWLVSLIDKMIATYEFYYSYGKPYAYRLSHLYVFMLFFRR